MKTYQFPSRPVRNACLSAVTFLALAGAPAASQATTRGLDTNAPNALWDTFVDTNSSGLLVSFGPSAPTSSNAFGDARLSATNSGGSVTGGGDRLYNGLGAASGAYNLALTGTASSFTDAFFLVLKMTAPDTATLLTRATFFNLTLNGAAPASVVQTSDNTGDPSIGGLPLGTVLASWSGLGLNPGDAYAVGISSPESGHVSLDALQVVPEPGTNVLLAVAGVLGGVVWRRAAGKRSLRLA